MVSSPYAPPKSDVRDVEPKRLLEERPRQVVHATLLFWLSFLISVPLMYWESQEAREEPATIVIGNTLVVLILAFMAVANSAMWRGRNWARIVFLIYSALSVFAFVAYLRETLQSSMIEIALTVVSMAMDVAVSYLLFTKPGALWFRTVQ